MEVSVETCWKSLNKIHEELCGDKVEILKTEDSDVVILADGMGSGVKANILATLTSKILRTMFQKGAPIEQGVETMPEHCRSVRCVRWLIPPSVFFRSFITEKPIWWNMTIRDVFLSGTAN